MYADRNSGGLQKKINTERVIGKALPSNIDAEKAVLGALLLNDE